jgi:glycosyltransferase involved in cell wall biosynthesis
MRSILGSFGKKPQMIHFITGEYPPLSGGVGDYTSLVANKLAEFGDQVNVWTGGQADAEPDRSDPKSPNPETSNPSVRRVAGRFGPRGLRNLDRELNRTPPDRRIVVQWTPHSFGFRSLNLALPIWLWKRARIDKDRVELMVHEPFVAFVKGKWRQNLAAVIHRGMAAILLSAASKVFVSIPTWETALRPWCLGRAQQFQWLPVPSNVETFADPLAVRHFRTSLAQKGNPIIGHFGTFRPDIAGLLSPALVQILETSRAAVLIAGAGSIEFHARFIALYPAFEDRIKATGELPSGTLAAFLSACDVLLQPYPDGISTRRGSTMAALGLGLPVVSNMGPLSERFWPRTNAVAIAPSCHPDDLASTTLSLCANRRLRSDIAKYGRELYIGRFALALTVKAFSPTSADRQVSQVVA